MYKYLKLNITNVDSSHYPRLVTCYFKDLKNDIIFIVEKVDIFTSGDINEYKLPLNGYLLKCRVIDVNQSGCLIDISEPYGVLDMNNNGVFWVDKNLISDTHFDEQKTGDGSIP